MKNLDSGSNTRNVSPAANILSLSVLNPGYNGPSCFWAESDTTPDPTQEKGAMDSHPDVHTSIDPEISDPLSADTFSSRVFSIAKQKALLPVVLDMS